MLELNFVSSDAKNRKRFENESNLKLEVIVENIAPGTFKSESMHEHVVVSYQGTQHFNRLQDLQSLAKKMANTYTDADAATLLSTIATYYPQTYFDIMTIIEAIMSAENFMQLADYAELLRREIVGEVQEHNREASKDAPAPEKSAADDKVEDVDDDENDEEPEEAVGDTRH